MGKPAKDLTGERFGSLVILRRDRTIGHSVRWACRCDCGKETSVYGQNLRSVRRPIRSCGCGAHPVRHGMTETRLYQTWASMFARCRYGNHRARKYYADRGITVCTAWRSFETFRDWALANGYRNDLTLDRINNDEGYSPGNCRFIPAAEQNRNKANHRMLMHSGETLALYQWSARTGIRLATLHNRLSRGWSVERALTTPARRQGC